MHRIRGSLLLAVLVLLLSGCVLRGPSDVRRDVAASTGAAYEREFAMTLGRVGTSLARWGLRVAGEDEILLRGVRKVEIGVYEVVRPPIRSGVHLGLGPEWSPLVAIREDGDDVQVLLRERGDTIRGMLVVVQDTEELVVVRMKGRLDRIVEEAIRYGLDEAGKPDLTDRTVEEYRSGA